MTRIALIDGPLAVGRSGCTALLDPSGEAVIESPAGQHAAAVAATIRAEAPEADILSIPVFHGKLSARIADLVSALELAADSDAAIVHCSLGLARDDAGVARAVAALAGRIVIASAPARGAPVWPAALPRVFSVQGDARCGAGQWSVLKLPAADYGACPRAGNGAGIAGASIAAAHMTGILAHRAPATEDAARAWLSASAAFHGRERRGGPEPGQTRRPRPVGAPERPDQGSDR